MSIAQYLKNEHLDPKAILDMSVAFEKVCNKLGVINSSDPFAELIAAKIIELRQRGVRNPTAMYFLAVLELGKTDEHAAQ